MKTVTFMIGAGGSGKSYALSQLPQAKSWGPVVNSDAFIEAHPQFISGELEAKDLHAWAETQMEEQWEALLKGEESFVLDGTGKTRANVERRVGQARQAGFAVRVFWVYAPLETCLERNQMRPRQVPGEVIQDAWVKVRANYGTYRELADEARVYVNY